MPVHGLLVVDKPAGPTSFQVVAAVRRALGCDRAGHTGTLDPAATGLLAVCLGEAVKLQQFLAVGDKRYEAEVAFGAATETEDAEGAVTARGDPGALTAAAVAAALPGFLGAQDQVPPMYSAVRVGGRRLHEAARAGEEVERQPRRIVVHGLDLLSFTPARDGLARARLDVRCGKGTYVRTLAVDLGKALGLPAHLAALRRTEAGPFTLAEAVPLDEVLRLAREGRAGEAAGAGGGVGGAPAGLRLLSLAEALRDLPLLPVDDAQAREIRQGKPLRADPLPAGRVRAVDPRGGLVAVCEPREGVLRPVRGFADLSAAPPEPANR